MEIVQFDNVELNLIRIAIMEMIRMRPNCEAIDKLKALEVKLFSISEQTLNNP